MLFGGIAMMFFCARFARFMRTRLVAYTLMALVASCLYTSNAHAQMCNAFDKSHITINGGDYIIQTNRFGSDQQLCVTVTTSGFTVSSSGITRSTNHPDSNSPGAYPSIYRGCHFSNASDCTDTSSNLPLAVTDIFSAVSDWQTQTPSSTDVYDVAYDLWFNSQRQVPAGAMPDGTELMIWLKKTGDITPLTSRNPRGPEETAFPLNNATWDVWFASPDLANNRPWKVVSYVLNTPNPPSITNNGVQQLNILAFINDAVRRGYLDSSGFLVSAEAGFEIWEGGTGLTTNSFSFVAQPGTGCSGLASAPLNIWWPTDGSVLSGTQPFKARLENILLQCYEMYWAVDGGQLNSMSDNSTGGDHKEATVDLSGWTWRDAGDKFGPFSVNFIAQDAPGHTVQQKAVTIYVLKPTLSVWWPTDGSVLSGTQPFKARLENMSLSSYQMYWSVDGGQLNLMSDNVDHKEASVDLSGWTWRDAGTNYGPFAVTFTAKNSSGTILQQKTVTIYRAK
jgi:glycosyl hydrolase family 12